MPRYKTILTIAGSDSIGGAGIQADIKTAAALGVHAVCAITAVTAQSTSHVAAIDPVSVGMLRLQLETVYEDITPDAVKIGIIPTKEHLLLIADFIKSHNLDNVVIDPVLVSTSGTRFTAAGVAQLLMQELFPLATLVTPNIPEAETLMGCPIDSEDTRIVAGLRMIRACGCKAVLLKGGHDAREDRLTDILISSGHDDAEADSLDYYEGISIERFTHSRIITPNTHGTGCTLSSAIASYLALGEPLKEAVKHGIEYLQRVLKISIAMQFGQSQSNGPIIIK